MKKIIEFLVGLLKRSHGWLRITLIILLCTVLGLLGFVYVSCGTFSLDALRWQHKDIPQVVVPAENPDSIN